MKYKKLYNNWCTASLEDADLTRQLAEMDGNEEEIKESFFKDLEFGTGGLRGVIGPGINRMNIYTVGKATQGMADYFKNKYPNCSAAIGYDSRNKSRDFAIYAARVLAGNGIKVHLYKELVPTPMVSFAIRHLGCKLGIMITASHNPAKYNGYKAYGADGCQMNLEDSEAVMEAIEKVDIFDDVKKADFEKALQDKSICYIGEDVIDAYIHNVKSQMIHPEICASNDLKIVYTPLNGAGNKPVRRTLAEAGFKDITVVKEQENPDGNFPTCPYPNPEFKEALEKGLELCQQVKPDLLLATDPDSDRVGIAIHDQGEYHLITGNETGALLLDYIARERTAKGSMPKNPIAIKTIVTTPLIYAIAKEYSVQVIDVLTGFKFIGEQIRLLESKNEESRYIFGFEESYGYLCGTYVRDKDAVVTSLLICEMAAYYKKQGKNLVQILQQLYQKHGLFYNCQDNLYFEGISGMGTMAKIMDTLQSQPPKEIAGYKVTVFSDYEKSVKTDYVSGTNSAIDLPKSKVLGFNLENGAEVIVRPSGTEPKIKIYYTTVANSLDDAKAQQQAIASFMKEFMH